MQTVLKTISALSAAIGVNTYTSEWSLNDPLARQVIVVNTEVTYFVR